MVSYKWTTKPEKVSGNNSGISYFPYSKLIFLSPLSKLRKLYLYNGYFSLWAILYVGEIRKKKHWSYSS